MYLVETVSHSGSMTAPAQLTDVRADPQAFLAINALLKAKTPLPSLHTAVIVLSDYGCVSHLDKVIDASKQKKIRPGNFTRMGPHTIATYVATACQIHGPTFALIGNVNEHLSQAYQIVESLLHTPYVKTVCLVMASPSECTIQLYQANSNE